MINRSQAKAIANTVNKIFWNINNKRSISDIVNEVLKDWQPSYTNEEVCMVLNYIVAANNYEEKADHNSYMGGRSGYDGDDLDGSEENWSNVVRSLEDYN